MLSTEDPYVEEVCDWQLPVRALHDNVMTWKCFPHSSPFHYGDVIMDTMASQITNLAIVYSNVYSDADQRKHQNSLAFVRGIHRGPVNSPHKWPVTRKVFPSDDVIMCVRELWCFVSCQDRLLNKQPVIWKAMRPASLVSHYTFTTPNFETTCPMHPG